MGYFSRCCGPKLYFISHKSRGLYKEWCVLLKAAFNRGGNYNCYAPGNLLSIVKEDKYGCLCVAGVRAEISSCSSWSDRRGLFRLGAVDLPLFHRFVLVHFDGGDGMLGTRLNLPVHLPLSVFRLGLEQVHPFLRFDPAGSDRGGKEMGRVSFIGGDDLCARSEVIALRVQPTSSLHCVMAEAIPQMNQ